MRRNAAVAAVLLGFSVLASGVVALADSSITAAGSTALLPLVKDAADAYQARHSEVKISVSGGGSGVGLNQVSQKAIDIGDSDILAPTGSTLVDNRVAVIGFSVIVNPSVGLKSLTRQQLRDIFTGKDTNWKQLGGPDQKIVPVNRTRGSGTRVVFERTVIAPDKVDESFVSEDATGTVVSFVKQTPGAISYAAFSGTKNQTGVVELGIDGVPATEANVITGKYPFWSYEHMFTNGPPAGDVQRFIAFIAGNNDLLKKNGFIRIADMKTKETDR